MAPSLKVSESRGKTGRGGVVHGHGGYLWRVSVSANQGRRGNEISRAHSLGKSFHLAAPSTFSLVNHVFQ